MSFRQARAARLSIVGPAAEGTASGFLQPTPHILLLIANQLT
jgi:hypothetical protein